MPSLVLCVRTVVRLILYRVAEYGCDASKHGFDANFVIRATLSRLTIHTQSDLLLICTNCKPQRIQSKNAPEMSHGVNTHQG